MILLDTNAVIAALNDRPKKVVDAIAARMQASDRIAISTIVLFEIWFGIGKSRNRQSNADQLQRFLAGAIEVLPFDDADAVAAGEVRAALATRGTPIGPYDVLIAGQSLRHKATLVTANTREFKRVKGLKVEDWGR